MTKLNSTSYKYIVERAFCNTISVGSGAKTDASGAEVAEGLLLFYRDIVSRLVEPSPAYEVVVFMVRKAWCLYLSLRPVLEEYCLELSEKDWETIDKKVTNDAFMSVWLNEKGNSGAARRGEIKVAVVDDTVNKGNAVGNCIRKLVHVYGLSYENVTIHVHKVEDNKKNRDAFVCVDGEYKVKVEEVRNREEGVIWEVPFFLPQEGSHPPFSNMLEMRAMTKRLVELFHATSVPYASFTPAFEFSLESAQDMLGSGILEGSQGVILQKHLSDPFSDGNKFSFFNTTCRPMCEEHMNVQAFMLCPVSDCGWDMPFANNSNVFKCVRVYVNYIRKKVLIVPCVTIPPIRAVNNNDFAALFVGFESLSTYFVENDLDPNTNVAEDILTELRLIKYAAGYVLGRSLFEYIGVSPTREIRVIPKSQRDIFSEWLDDRGLDAKICDYFRSIQDDIELPFFDRESEYKTLYESLFVTSTPVSFFASTAELFRQIQIKDIPGVPRYELVDRFTDTLMRHHKKYVRTYCFHHAYANTVFAMDSGEAALYIRQKESADKGEVRSIGSYLFAGEQSCHAIYNAIPSYAYFLQRLQDARKREELALHKKECLVLVKRVEKALKNSERVLRRKGTANGFIYSVKYLVAVLRGVLGMNGEKEGVVQPFSAIRPDDVDSLSIFFNGLIAEYRI